MTEEEFLVFEISFQLGRITKSEFNTLRSHDCTAKDRVRRAIATRIVERLKRGYTIVKHETTMESHSAP